jgi:hypothetical protein
MTLPYETIFSRYLGILEDQSELNLKESDLMELEVERLHQVFGDPRILGKFDTLELDDDFEEITFELKNSVSEFADQEYLSRLLSLGMAIEWYQHRINNRKYTLISLGGKEEKMLQNLYKQLQERQKTLQKEFSNLLSYHGYINNSYLQGGN